MEWAWLELAPGGRGRDDGGRVLLPAHPQLVHAQAGQLVHTERHMLAADIKYFYRKEKIFLKG